MANRDPAFQRDSPESPDPPQPVSGISLGMYSEDWIREWQGEMVVCHQQLMNRLVTKYYGIWPSDEISEMVLYQAALKMFSHCRTGIRKREALVMYLSERIDSEGLYDAEGSGLLSRLHVYLSRRLDSFGEKYKLFKNFSQVEGRKSQEVISFLDDLKAHSEAFKKAAYDEMIENAIREVRQMAVEVPDDVLDPVFPIPEHEDEADDDEVVVKKDEANADGERKAVGKKDDDGDKMVTDKGDDDKIAIDKGDDNKGATEKDDAGDDNKVVTEKDDAGEDYKKVPIDDIGDDGKMMIEKDDSGEDDKMVTEKDDAVGGDKKASRIDTMDWDKIMTDRDDTSHGIDRIETDTSTDDKMEAEKDDTGDEIEKIGTDKDDTSNEDKMVAEKDDTGDDGKAEGKKDDDAGKDGKMVTEQQDDSEDGWC